MPTLQNPILPGFNPDPSILRVGSNYFIATSTFEWYPGVQIHHSTDLANWSLVCRPLCHHPSTSTSSSPINAILDMRGEPDSCGVWAPCLSYSQKRFWLVYTDVRRKDGHFKDTVNWIVTLDDPEGDGSALLSGKSWGEPIYVAQNSGFDPSLFHDDDENNNNNTTGKKYFISMLQDHRAKGRPGGRSFAGIIMQEFDASTMKLVGPRRNVFRGTELDLVEGPHLYRKDGYYYLLTAEGGTGYGHAATLARSKNVWGPYDGEGNSRVLLNSKWDGNARLQRAGHGSLVDTPDGKRWYLVHLMGRMLKGTERKDERGIEGKVEGRCPLGRETSIQEVEWKEEDGWCYLKGHQGGGGGADPGVVPLENVDVPGTRDEGALWAEKRYRFLPPTTITSSSNPDEDIHHRPALHAPEVRGLHKDFQWLRTPEPERIFRVEEPGKLVLVGRESPGSWVEQSLVARRQTHFSYDAETVLAAGYAPEDERQFAGLIAYYCRYNFFYLSVSGTTGLPTDTDKGGRGRVLGREIQILSSEASWPEGKLESPVPRAVPLPDGYMGRVKLALTVRGKEGKFFYAIEKTPGGTWEDLRQVGDIWDASILSDECGGHQAHGSFTGTFVGVACSDLNGTAMEAGFEEFVYRPVRDD